MKKNHPVFSSDPVDITLPLRWAELNRKQFRTICSLLAAEIPAYTLDTILFMRLSGLHYIGRCDGTTGLGIHRLGRRIHLIPDSDIAAGAHMMQWVHHVAPLRELAALMPAVHRSARDITLRELNFADFLAADSALQAYLATQDQAHTNRLIRTLWPRLKPRRIRPWHHTAAIIWFSAFRQHIQTQYPNLFAPAAPGDIFGGAQQDIRTAINTQIRALTKGDVTAEERVLAVPCHRALRELDELAREYQELKSTGK